MKKKLFFLLPALILLFALFYLFKGSQMKSGEEFYVGTYTNGNSEGIYKYILFDNGEMELIGLVAKSENPSFITKSADNKYLIAVNENTEGRLESYEIMDDSLKLLNQSYSGGAHPCFVAADNSGYVISANYSSGNIALHKLSDNGELSPLLDSQQHHGSGAHARQDSPHAHSSWFNPIENNIISVDLGTNELIFSSIDVKSNKLVPFTQEKLKMDDGAGPRHLDFHPQEPWIYVLNELNSTVSLIKKMEGEYAIQSTISTLPENYEGGNTCADIHISKDGKFLYASNRGHNSIVIYAIDTEGGLKLLGHESTRGETPRNFSLSPDNNHLLVANQQSDNIVSFKRSPETGLLTYVSDINAPVPVCILF